MADLLAVTASIGSRLHDPVAVPPLLTSSGTDPTLHLGIEPDTVRAQQEQATNPSGQARRFDRGEPPGYNEDDGRR
jgi:hypothetical protein